jgi:NADH-quinone oxidoreductase subunit K
MISVWHFLAVGTALFALGLVGFLTRRNLITVFLCAEMMLQGVVINLLAFGQDHGHIGGQIFALFIITVAACEAGLALALFLTLYRRVQTLDTGAWIGLREQGVAASIESDALPTLTVQAYPTLSVAGRQPHESQEAARV